MAELKPKIGQQVYLSDGRKAEFAGMIDGQNFVRVMHFLSNEYGEQEWPSDKLTPVGEVYASEPMDVLGPETKAAEERVAELRKERNAIEAEVSALRAEKRQIEESIRRFPDLSTAIDFMTGAITHVVEMPSYSTPKIHTLEEYLENKSDRGRFEGLKLVSLFGTDERKVARWKANRYYDGSGSNYEILPFKSLEAAEDYIRSQQKAAIEAWRSGDKKHDARRYLDSPVEMDWPADFMAEVNAQKNKSVDEQIERLKAQIASIEATRPTARRENTDETR